MPSPNGSFSRKVLEIEQERKAKTRENKEKRKDKMKRCIPTEN